MEDQIISFKTAQLAKEKKFNVKCQNFYNAGSGYKLQKDYLLRTGNDIFIEAPTQSLLQKWLREVHNIDIVIEAYFDDDGKKWYNGYLYTDLINEDYHDEEPPCKSYEEQLEIALFEALKLLK